MTGVLQVEVDNGVIIVRLDGRPDDAAFDAYLKRYTELIERRVPYTTVYSTTTNARMPAAGHARRQAAWMKEYRDFAGQYCRGLAFAFKSPLMRGVLRGILAMQPLGAEHIVMDDEAAAIAWARARLQGDG